MVALAAGIPGGLSKAIQVNARDLSEDSKSGLTKTAFEASLNSRFLIRAEGAQSFELRLAQVADLKRHKKGKVAAANKEGFSLLFEGPKGIPQANYSFEHDKMGKFDLLMVPIQSRKKLGHSYEVVINRLFA
jgi:hypothetical protein